MKKYRVIVHERWVQTVEVKAESPSDAKMLVAKGGGETLLGTDEFVELIGDPENWDVHEVKE